MSPAGIDAVTHFARARVLLAFDFDGTLSPIVAERGAARMRAPTRRLFNRVCTLYPCVVISGRSTADAAARVRGARVQSVVGNHGAESGSKMVRFEREVAAVLPALERALAAVQGVDVENKRYSLAIHYRKARRKKDALARILRALSRVAPEMRVVLGKAVVNAVPARAPHKGDALEKLRKKSGSACAIYIGDDVTDEDVFALHKPDRLLCIRVGRSAASEAEWYLRDQEEMDALLRLLIDTRAPRKRRA